MMVSATFFIAPPTPSQGPLPWPASSQCQAPVMLKREGNFSNEGKNCLIPEWELGPWEIICRKDNAGRMVASSAFKKGMVVAAVWLVSFVMPAKDIVCYSPSAALNWTTIGSTVTCCAL